MRQLHMGYSGLGGTNAVLRALLSSARKEGCEGDYLFLFYGVESLEPQMKSLCENYGLDYRYFRKLRGYDLKGLWSISGWLMEQSPDIVFAHSDLCFLAGLLAKMRGFKAPVCYVEHQSVALRGKKVWFCSLLSQFFADHRVYLTDFSRNKIKEFLSPFFRDEACSVIENGVDVDLFSPCKKEGKKVFRWGMAARIVEIRRQKDMILAQKRLKEEGIDTVLTFAGDGLMMGELIMLAEDLGLVDCVEFVGFLDESELLEWMRGLDLYLHASLGETASTAIMQAQACGLGVVGTRVSGVARPVEEGGGVVVEARDPDAIFEVVRDLFEDRERLLEMGRRSRGFAEKFLDQKLMWQKYQALIEGCLRKKD